MTATFPAAVVLTACLLGQAPDLPDFVKERVKDVTFYYQSPDATLGPKLLAELLEERNIEHPWFKKNNLVFLIIGAQLGDIAADEPEIIRQYEAAFAAAPTAGRKVILRALQNCGDDETLPQVEKWLADEEFADVKPELQALQKHLADPERKHVRDRPAVEPKDLDLLWANFFITGEYEPVSRILDVFDLPDAKQHEVMKRVARWSLGSNVQQHKTLADLVWKKRKDRPAASRKVIEETIIVRQPEGKP